MAKIINEWDVTGNGDYILTLDTPIPNIFFNRYRIDNKDYPVVPVHFSGIDTFHTIGIKAEKKHNFTGKCIDFINA